MDDPCSKLACAPLLEEVATDIGSDLWESAAQHGGEELVGLGPGCLEESRKQIDYLVRKGAAGAAGLLRQAVTGGLWPQKRRFEADLVESAACPWCVARQQDEFHVIWECEPIQKSEGVKQLKDNKLQETARQLGRKDVALWTRGMATEADTTTMLDGP